MTAHIKVTAGGIYSPARDAFFALGGVALPAHELVEGAKLALLARECLGNTPFWAHLRAHCQAQADGTAIIELCQLKGWPPRTHYRYAIPASVRVAGRLNEMADSAKGLRMTHYYGPSAVERA